MQDFIICKINSIGYNIYKKRFTICVKEGENSINCFLQDSIIKFATEFYENNCVCVATINKIKNKLIITNLRRGGVA